MATSFFVFIGILLLVVLLIFTLSLYLIRKIFRLEKKSVFKTLLAIFVLFVGISGVTTLSVLLLQNLDDIALSVSILFISIYLITYLIFWLLFRSSLLKNIFVTLLFLIFVITLILGVRIASGYTYSVFQVSGNAMAPQLYENEYVVIQRLFSDVKRGDIVLVQEGGASLLSSFFLGHSGGTHLARIIGLSGETVEIHDNIISINGRELPSDLSIDEEEFIKGCRGEDAPYPPGAFYLNTCKNKVWVLDEDEYFIARNIDNVFFHHVATGPINKEGIIGKYWLTLTPPLNP
jgi:signal peptidase I